MRIGHMSFFYRLHLNVIAARSHICVTAVAGDIGADNYCISQDYTNNLSALLLLLYLAVYLHQFSASLLLWLLLLLTLVLMVVVLYIDISRNFLHSYCYRY